MERFLQLLMLAGVAHVTCQLTASSERFDGVPIPANYTRINANITMRDNTTLHTMIFFEAPKPGPRLREDTLATLTACINYQSRGACQADCHCEWGPNGCGDKRHPVTSKDFKPAPRLREDTLATLTACINYQSRGACQADCHCKWGPNGCGDKHLAARGNEGRLTSLYILCSYGDDRHEIFIKQWAQQAALSLTEADVLDAFDAYRSQSSEWDVKGRHELVIDPLGRCEIRDAK